MTILLPFAAAPQAVVLAGGAAGLLELRREIRLAQREQQRLCTDLQQSTQRMKSPKVAVDAVFARRLLKMLAMWVPCCCYCGNSGTALLCCEVVWSRLLYVGCTGGKGSSTAHKQQF